MNGITVLLWITIVLIGIIAIVVVKLHYQGDQLETEEESILPNAKTLNKTISAGVNLISRKTNNYNSRQKTNYQNNFNKDTNFQTSINHEVENEIHKDYPNSNESNKLNQTDIMSPDNDQNEKTELKDLFTIDELIKESKRKDSEREKDTPKEREDDEEINQLKESIKRKQENPDIDNELLEQIEADIKEMKEEGSISDLINEEDSEEKEAADIDEDQTTLKTSTVAPKDIEKAINTAAQENEEKEEVEEISETKNITEVLLNKSNEEKETKQIKQVKEIKEEKQEEPKMDNAIGAPKKIDEERKEEKIAKETVPFSANELDYRNDLTKIKKSISGSKIYQEVKEKIITDEPAPEEEFIRNVNEYDEYAPIINETHADFDGTYEDYHNADFERRLREENTRKVFKMAENSKNMNIGQSKVGAIKEKPARDNIKIVLNNDERVLKKGDEIIFNHNGDTYSSQVYAINGDDISVRYRRKDIKIKPGDVKKIY